MRHSTSLLLFSTLLSAVPLIFAAPWHRRTLNEKRQTSVPSYVTEYAPILYLATDEAYFPSDIGAQLTHTTPKINNVTVTGAPSPLTLDNLGDLNSLTNSSSIYLTSDEGIEALPSWFDGVKPDSAGRVSGAYTNAIIVTDKSTTVGAGYVDVFYMYFYAYNQGNDVSLLGDVDLGEFGDHVGDWEHTMVRFLNGVPQAIWLSQHASGEAFTYSAMSKSGVRPIIYVGKGTHANWATTGDHDHTITGVDLPVTLLLTDHTSQGPLYDPVQSAYFVTYNVTTETFGAYDSTTPTNWLYFIGHWGDDALPSTYPGQVILFGQAKYAGGPTGPEAKDLNRTEVCNMNDVDTCIISPVLLP